MPDIYDHHAAAFANVSAFIVTRGGEKVATIAFKFPRDGAGRIYAYVHWLGLPMVRGFASGGGYDKRTAAVFTAARKFDCGAAEKVATESNISEADGRPWLNGYKAFLAACSLNDGYDGYNWQRNLEQAGFTVWQAV